ncbi:SDR family oxidoreductase [Goodfellowiella coeruleoviolacea]|uniref:3-oxoacyl-[acyl-carrier protein] reductase n=1 Tax=Goodfellowiella coeruleoviolacea TaxID=334858 RepID=A0AAE3GDF1_9PSEU|nr:SDR family oxidoreductase [Goodfellowiella coeruleoviolacea]MCP2166075.1 3-oxoacyl-[acyl-carrier protein] reductase [Goodfellowiella coeruleoviolacea]
MTQTRQVALVTGASRGIGAATARELGRRGYHVLVNYRSSAAAAEAVVADIEAAGGSARAVRADVCVEQEVAGLVDTALAAHGRLDVLVCNANVADPPFAPMAALPWADFIAKVGNELAGVYFVTQRALAAMRERRAGRIVYISSTAADNVGGSIAHSTAKAALNTFAHHLAAEAGRHGITVNCVAPDATDTDAAAGFLSPAMRAHLDSHSVLGRMLTPEDIARVVGSVVDPGFAGVTGAVVRVDGGRSVLESARPRLSQDQPAPELPPAPGEN